LLLPALQFAIVNLSSSTLPHGHCDLFPFPPSTVEELVHLGQHGQSQYYRFL
jgi:hypothetical protein